jgi:co-chaperonin GroES (HSP10)
MQIIVFLGKVLIEMDVIHEKKNGIIIMDKKRFKRTKGKVIKSGSKKIKTGDHILFFPTKGVIMEGKCLIDEKDIVLILKNKGMKVLGERVIIEPEMSADTVGGIKLSDAHRELLPKGKILKLSNMVVDLREGDEVLFDKDRAMNITPYEISEYKGRNIFLVKRQDILAVL